ncbi:MAG: DUF4358 domain-containing protein [Ruminococcaceae bacterium]|nr:DUF4358 domain-containing protein [Oscillospiraceae bacterium]
MKKILSITLIIITLLVTLISCTQQEVTYKTDVKTFNIYSTVTKLLKNNKDTYVYGAENLGFEDLDDIYQGTSHVKYNIGMNTEWTNDYFVETSGGNGCFEYGVFKATSKEAVESIKAKLEEYITRLQNDELGLSYSPDDKLILDKASVAVYGEYVVYVIVPEADSATILARTENLLTQE